MKRALCFVSGFVLGFLALTVASARCSTAGQERVFIGSAVIVLAYWAGCLIARAIR